VHFISISKTKRPNVFFPVYFPVGLAFVICVTNMGVVLKKKYRKAHKNPVIFSSTSASILNQYLLYDEVFTFIALQTKIWRVWERVPTMVV